MRRMIVPAAVLAVVATACSLTVGSKQGATSAASPVAEPQVSTPVVSGSEPVADVVARVLPAVVNVTTDIVSGDGQTGRGVGTGFIVRSDGVIVTNCHVVEGGSKVTVSTSDAEPRRFDARVIGGDCEHDLAVLKVDAKALPTVPLGSSSDLRLGQRVIALGYALALEGGPTVTTGIVSALDRTITAQDPGCDPAICGQDQTRTYADVIQTDAAINHGNSGGPLVNMAGQVVGINSAGDDAAENIGFAIAIDSAKATIDQAESDPLAPSAYLGVTTQPVTSDLAFQLNLTVDSGAYVVATSSGGPADSAGIRQGDVIVSVDGQAIGSSEELGGVLSDLRPGDRVTVEVVGSDGQQRSVEVTLGERPLPIDLP
ncbi:MAG TPA: trypsin-like peptidase domain-containing protein [Actinomycetota bacterium]|jgi:S1-C subfamily serine protease